VVAAPLLTDYTAGEAKAILMEEFRPFPRGRTVAARYSEVGRPGTTRMGAVLSGNRSRVGNGYFPEIAEKCGLSRNFQCLLDVH